MGPKRKFLRYIIALGLLALLASALALVLIYRTFTADLPNIATLQDYRPRIVTKVFSEDGNVIGEFFIEKRELVPMEKVPEVLRDAIIAAEDANFYQHEGLDFYGIIRAMIKNIRAGGIVQGGSTITQQVVKSLLLTPERSIQRKIKEAILAYRLERSLSKEEILYLYLNQIYFGHGAYGVQVAAQNYFGHDVSEVDLAEAALLAGLPRAPSRYSPARKGNAELARERQEYVLRQMLGEEMVSQEEVDRALARPILVVEEDEAGDRAEEAGPISKEEILGQPEPIRIQPFRRINTEIAPYFIDTVREHLLKNYGKEKTFCGGLRVYTTLREDDQKAAQEAIQFGVDAYLKRQPEKAAEEADNPIDGALLAIDLPEGYVRAMVGGLDHDRSQYNCAVQARRQPGSAVKPMIYGAALDKGYTPATIIVDSPLVFNDPVLDEKWKPKNYSRYFVGPTTLRDALTHSRNVVTIKILRDIGVSYAIRYARRLGVTSPLSPDLSLALGSSEITLQELLVVYSVFAMEGRRPDPISIHKILDADGQVIEENLPHAEEVISPQTAYLVTSMLQSVVQEGTGRAVRSLGVPCAGKTGTTNEFRDAWFIGYTPDRIAGVWIGRGRPENLGKKETGGRAAAPVWLHYMKKTLPKGARKGFTMPSGMVFSRVDTQTGLLATRSSKKTRLECFTEGTEPKEFSPEERDQDEADFFKEEFDPLDSLPMAADLDRDSPVE
ncbi:MAG: penicillin-binding protein 1A [Thermodesulfobacteriota bacterium]